MKILISILMTLTLSMLAYFYVNKSLHDVKVHWSDYQSAIALKSDESEYGGGVAVLPKITDDEALDETKSMEKIPDENNIDASNNAHDTEDYPMIKEGAKDSYDTQLQKQLLELGYFDDKADGIFGPKTSSAVKEFQTNNGLKSDEIVGKDTWSVLYDSPVPATQ